MSAVSPQKKVVKAKKPAKPSAHPPVAAMVKAAITGLKDKKGSSLAAIKKYIQANYKGIDMVRIAPFIRRFMKKALADGTLATAKGHAGSFKLGEKAKKAPKAVKKPKKAKTPKKKAAKPKKVKTPKKAKAAAKPKKVKTPKKAAKPKKAAAAKPKKAKTPKKPKAAKPKKAKTPKKAAKK